MYHRDSLKYFPCISFFTPNLTWILYASLDFTLPLIMKNVKHTQKVKSIVK